jgi:hypothetical protein
LLLSLLGAARDHFAHVCGLRMSLRWWLLALLLLLLLLWRNM